MGKSPLPDIIFLQEVHGKFAASFLSQNLGMPYFCYTDYMRDKEGNAGLAIISRKPLENEKVYYFSESRTGYGALAAEIRIVWGSDSNGSISSGPPKQQEERCRIRCAHHKNRRSGRPHGIARTRKGGNATLCGCGSWRSDAKSYACSHPPQGGRTRIRTSDLVLIRDAL